jgi:hypothetical protein
MAWAKLGPALEPVVAAVRAPELSRVVDERWAELSRAAGPLRAAAETVDPKFLPVPASLAWAAAETAAPNPAPGRAPPSGPSVELVLAVVVVEVVVVERVPSVDSASVLPPRAAAETTCPKPGPASFAWAAAETAAPNPAPGRAPPSGPSVEQVVLEVVVVVDCVVEVERVPSVDSASVLPPRAAAETTWPKPGPASFAWAAAETAAPNPAPGRAPPSGPAELSDPDAAVWARTDAVESSTAIAAVMGREMVCRRAVKGAS